MLSRVPCRKRRSSLVFGPLHVPSPPHATLLFRLAVVGRDVGRGGIAQPVFVNREPAPPRFGLGPVAYCGWRGACDGRRRGGRVLRPLLRRAWWMCSAHARRCGATAAAASRPLSRDAELAPAVTRRAERLRIVVIWPPRAPSAPLPPRTRQLRWTRPRRWAALLRRRARRAAGRSTGPQPRPYGGCGATD